MVHWKAVYVLAVIESLIYDAYHAQMAWTRHSVYERLGWGSSKGCHYNVLQLKTMNVARRGEAEMLTTDANHHH